MPAKYPTTVRDAEAPFTKRTVNRVLIGADEITVSIRPAAQGEKGKWTASAGGVEASGLTIDKAVDASIAARLEFYAAQKAEKAEAATVPAPESTEETPAPVKAKGKKGKAKKGKAPVVETPAQEVPVTVPAESVSLSGVLSDVPLSVPAPVPAKEAVKKGTALTPPKAVDTTMTGPKLAALIQDSWDRSAKAVTLHNAGALPASDAQKVVLGARAEITGDLDRAMTDGVSADIVLRIRGYMSALMSNHAALTGAQGTRLTPAQGSRARNKIRKALKILAS